VTRAGSLALAIDGRVVARAGDPSRTHGARLPAELIAFLAEHGLTIRDLDLTAVVVGPGSFTGLRVGLASMQGLAIGRQLRVVGIPTLEAVAASWTFATGARGRVIACIDGQRGDVFLAGYDVPPAGFHAARVIVPPMVGTPDEAAQVVRDEHADRQPPLLEIEPRLPIDLVTIVKRAMALSPAHRYPTAGEMAADLRRFQTGQLVGAHHYTTWQLIRRLGGPRSSQQLLGWLAKLMRSPGAEPRVDG